MMRLASEALEYSFMATTQKACSDLWRKVRRQGLKSVVLPPAQHCQDDGRVACQLLFGVWPSSDLSVLVRVRLFLWHALQPAQS